MKKVNIELSPKMQAVVSHMKLHGVLVRYPGGYWADTNWHMWHGPCWGTPTIEGIVKRGFAKYTVWKDGRNGKFPIQCELNSIPKGRK